MATDLNTSSSSNPTSVVSDIIHDAEQLLTQQFKMFQAEIREDISRVRQAAQPLLCGLATLALGALLLSVALVFLVNWIWPGFPLWGAFAIVGGLLTATGVGLYYVGKQQLDSFNPLPDKSAQALKENLQWLTPK